MALRFESFTDGAPETLHNSLTILKTGKRLATDCLHQGVQATAISALDGSAYSLVESRFFVRVGGSGRPELFCAGNGNAFRPAPLMEFVEDMRIHWGVTAGPHSQGAVRYLNAAQVDRLGGSPTQNWSRVVSLQLCVLLRSESPAPRDLQTVYRDCSGMVATSSDGLLRRAYSTVITLRNRVGLAGVP